MAASGLGRLPPYAHRGRAGRLPFARVCRARRGISLLELLVVIGVIAALSGVVLTYVGDSKDAAADAVVKQNLKLTREALGRYFQANMQYPMSLASLTGAYLQQPYEELLLTPMAGRATALEVNVPDTSVPGVSTNAYQATVTTWVTYPPTPLREIRNVRVQGSPYDTW